MDDVKRLRIVEGISLALGKINLLSSYVYKLAEIIDKENPDIVIGDIEQMMGKNIEIEEMAIRLRFRDSITKKNGESNTENSLSQIERAAQ